MNAIFFFTSEAINILLAGPAEISTERGDNLFFSHNILFQYKCIHRTKVLEGIRKKC